MGHVTRLFTLLLLRIVQLGSAIAVLSAVHSLINLKLLRKPVSEKVINEKISVLLPVLNEADRIAPTLQSLLNQKMVPNLEIIIRDDGSTDQTVSLIKHLIQNSPITVELIVDDQSAPEGWVSKSWSCYQMSKMAVGSVLVFTDADVKFAPTALAQSVATLRDAELDLISPYPKQVAISWSERLIQPLLQWSWLSFLPLRIAEKSKNPNLVASNGQFIVVDATKYRVSGGHSAYPDAVLDDIALLRAIKNNSGRGNVIDGTNLATTRMYRNVTELTNGYTKSLWSVTNNRFQSRLISIFFLLGYVLPPLAALSRLNPRIQRAGAVGYLAAVLSRLLIAIRTKSAEFPDVMTHPISILGLVGLTELSWYRRVRKKLTWRGKKLP